MSHKEFIGANCAVFHCGQQLFIEIVKFEPIQL
jgi:hypothetical protein